ncbi:MAG: hypothetical protein PHR16_05705 [Methylovulum sp.]|nr:hypothetical protein [Methylovulum sp.]
MKITTPYQSLLLISALLANGGAFAYDPDKEKDCKKPRFSDFNLTEYSAANEVKIAPETEFFFKLSPWVDPSTIKVTIKGQPIEFTVDSNSSFHKVTAKLPAALAGQFARINASAKAVLGCDSQDGWLVKIAEQ